MPNCAFLAPLTPVPLSFLSDVIVAQPEQECQRAEVREAALKEVQVQTRTLQSEKEEEQVEIPLLRDLFLY